MRTEKRELPDLPSELLIVAMEDLEAVERSKKYSLDMGDWHWVSSSGMCEVCHAGAVMANSLQAPITKYSSPLKYELGINRKLSAINSIRQGDIDIFFRELKVTPPKSFMSLSKQCILYTEDIEINGSWFDPSELSISEDPELFQHYKNWIVGFIGILQAEGL